MLCIFLFSLIIDCTAQPLSVTPFQWTFSTWARREQQTQSLYCSRPSSCSKSASLPPSEREESSILLVTTIQQHFAGAMSSSIRDRVTCTPVSTFDRVHCLSASSTPPFSLICISLWSSVTGTSTSSATVNIFKHLCFIETTPTHGWMRLSTPSHFFAAL